MLRLLMIPIMLILILFFIYAAIPLVVTIIIVYNLHKLIFGKKLVKELKEIELEDLKSDTQKIIERNKKTFLNNDGTFKNRETKT